MRARACARARPREARAEPPTRARALRRWFGTFYILFFLAATVCLVPYDALGPELADNSDTRAEIFFTAGMFDAVGTLIAAAGPVVIAMLLLANPAACGCAVQCVSAAPSSGCVERCQADCSTSADRRAMMMLGGGFALWALGSNFALVAGITERPASASASRPPFVPALMSTVRNKPFRMLLPAWACDSVNNGLIAALLPWYVAHVVAPEGSCPAGEEPGSFWCSTSTVLASALLAALIAAACSAPVWLMLSKRLGKHRVWLSFNLLNAVTNLGFIACGRGATRATVFVAALNGMPLGAKFLSEAVLADIVDYDEFLSGRRSEGNYTVFKSLLPKFIGIPTSAIPLTVMNALGFVPSVGGLAQPQPDAVVAFLRITFVVVPVFFALTSFAIKLRYPLSDEDTIRQISAGIGAHLHGQGFIDPISKKLVEHWQPQGRDEWQVWLLESFPTVGAMQTLLSPNGAFPLKRAMAKHLRTSTIGLMIALATAIATMPLLEQPQASVVPVLATIAVGVGVASVVFFLLRLNAARALVRYGYDPELVQVMLAKRTGHSMDEYNARFRRSAHTRDPAIATEDGNRESIALLRDELHVVSVKLAALATDYEGRLARLESHVLNREAHRGLPSALGTPSVFADISQLSKRPSATDLIRRGSGAHEEAAALLGAPAAADDAAALGALRAKGGGGASFGASRDNLITPAPLGPEPAGGRPPHSDGVLQNQARPWWEHEVHGGPTSDPESRARRERNSDGESRVRRPRSGAHPGRLAKRSWTSVLTLSLPSAEPDADQAVPPAPALAAVPSGAPMLSCETAKDQISRGSDTMRV